MNDTPLQRLKAYADAAGEQEWLDDPGAVINKLVSLINKLPSQPSSEGSGEVGLRWVSDRLPKKSGEYFVKMRHENSMPHNKVSKDTCLFSKKQKKWVDINPSWKILEWLDEEYTLPSNSEYYPDDLQNQVREHIKQHDLFNWHEALSENEMTLLENLLLTFSPEFPQGSIGYEKANKWHRLPSNSNVERFIKPEDDKIIKAAILFNDGRMDRKQLSNMVALCNWIVDRLYENGDITIPSSKE